MESKTVWERRIERMRDAGLTREQVETVFDIISEARSFHSQKTEDSARSKLDAVYGAPEDDPTAPLRNTELGDHCVNHDGVWEGTFSDALTGYDPDPQPICSEVAGGFEPFDQGCRFVPADSTDEARMNTPADERAGLYRVTVYIQADDIHSARENWAEGELQKVEMLEPARG
jgi:hypothetical protein